MPSQTKKDNVIVITDHNDLVVRHVVTNIEQAKALVEKDGMALKEVWREVDGWSHERLRDTYINKLVAEKIERIETRTQKKMSEAEKQQVTVAPVPLHADIDIHHMNDFRNNEDLVMAAVTQNGKALQFASPTLKQNRQVVLAAVTQNGEALYAAPAFFDDKEVVMTAVKTSWRAINCVGKELIKDEEVARLMVQRNPMLLGRVLEHHSDNVAEEFINQAISGNGLALKHAGVEAQSDRELVKKALWQNPGALSYASKELQDDWQLKALQTIRSLLGFAFKFAKLVKPMTAVISVAVQALISAMKDSVSTNTNAKHASVAGAFNGSYFFSKGPHKEVDAVDADLSSAPKKTS